MNLKRTTIAKIDNNTGLVVKRMETSEGDILTRKVAVNNTFFGAEKQRMLAHKPILDAVLQTLHIHYNKWKGYWRIQGAEHRLEEAQAHAARNKRLFIAYLQNRQAAWDALTWEVANENFLILARLGTPIVPFCIPLDGALEEWNKYKEQALRVLNKSQELMPVLCLFHEPIKFAQIIKSEFGISKYLGLHYFNINATLTRANLNFLHTLTYQQTVGTEVPLVVAFCPDRYIRSMQNASSAYMLSLFGVDFVSYYVYTPEQAAIIEDQSLEKMKFYDSEEGGYNDTETQVVWYGKDLTRENLESISVAEGLSPYLANRWADYLKEAEDLDVLNSAIINGTAEAVIKEKSRWFVPLVDILAARKQQQDK